MRVQLFFLINCLSFSLSAQTYKVNSNKVWFSSQGFDYTEGHFEKVRRFAEFLLDQKLNFAELKDAKDEAKKTFMANPSATLNEVEEIDQQMQQVYALTDVQTVGLVRSALLLHVYDALLREPQMPLLGKYIEKYCKVLAYDFPNNLVFTQKDADGLLNLIEFVAKINGNPTKLSDSERHQTTQQLAKNFNNLSLQEKQLMCIMGIMNDYIQTVYNSATFAQKNQIREELNKSFAAAADKSHSSQNTDLDYSKFNNMNESSYQLLSNMLLSSHITNMNILNAAGGSDDYWYIKNY